MKFIQAEPLKTPGDACSYCTRPYYIVQKTAGIFQAKHMKLFLTHAFIWVENGYWGNVSYSTQKVAAEEKSDEFRISKKAPARAK